LPPVLLTLVANCHLCCDPAANLPLVLLKRVANLPPVSTTTAVSVAKLSAGVNDTGAP